MIDVESNEGLGYKGNGNTLWLVDSIQNTYSEHLTKNIKLIIQEMIFKTDKELKNIIFAHNKDEQNEFNSFYPFTEEV